METVRLSQGDRLSGDGKLIDRAGSEVATVHYDIQIRQETISVRTHSGTESAPRFKIARGQLITKSGKPDYWSHLGEPFTLRLDDGSTVEIDVQPDPHRDAQLHWFSFRGEIVPPDHQ